MDRLITDRVLINYLIMVNFISFQSPQQHQNGAIMVQFGMAYVSSGVSVPLKEQLGQI
jgi:hypothetical protein